jgi:hypothetical protein
MSNEETKTEKLLQEIRALLILLLSKKDVTNEEIGSVLGVSYKTIERILPKKRKAKKKE